MSIASLEGRRPVVCIEIATEIRVRRVGRFLLHRQKVDEPSRHGKAVGQLLPRSTRRYCPRMKASVFHECGGPEVLRVEQLPDPSPGPGEVRVRVHAAALNHLDCWVRRGLPMEMHFPHIGGSDIAGVVDQIGEGADEAWSGQRVVVDPSLHYGWYDRMAAGSQGAEDPTFGVIGEHSRGGLAEYVVVPAANVVALPEAVDFGTAAAASLVTVTAWHALHGRAQLRSGESVLVTGASGGVATMAVQLAAHAGARVYAVTSGEKNVERVRDLGAEIVYDRLGDDWSKALWKDTGRRGVDVVLDSVGEVIWSSCIRALAPYGRLVTYGGTTGPLGKTNIPLVFWKQLSILGSTMGTPQEFRDAMALVFAGTVAPVIQEELSLEEVRRGHEMLEAGEVFGKLVVRP